MSEIKYKYGRPVLLREFKWDEIIPQKCPNCGARNKVYTNLINRYTKKHAGRTLKCCECGYEQKFIGTPCDEMMTMDQNTITDGLYCIRLTYCQQYINKSCPLMNRELKDYLKDGELVDESRFSKCSCDSCSCFDCGELLCDKNQNALKRQINVIPICQERFR